MATSVSLTTGMSQSLCPNCLRSRVYWRVRSSALRASPTPMAATMGRAKSSTSMRYLKPWRRSPTIWLSSTTTSSKVTVAVLERCCPSFSSGLPMTILPPPFAASSVCGFVGTEGLPSRNISSAGTMQQARNCAVGLPTLQKTVNWLA